MIDSPPFSAPQSTRSRPGAPKAFGAGGRLALGIALPLALALAAGPRASAEGQAAPATAIPSDAPAEAAEAAGPQDVGSQGPGSDVRVPPTAMAQFTTAIEGREPVDQVSFVSNETRQIFLFSDLRHLQGHRVTHRWIYRDKVMAEVAFEVGGPRWRVWSSKRLLPDWVGDWTVEVVTDEGEVIAAETLTISEADS